MTLDRLKERLNQLLEYCWQDELEDYQQNPDDEGHIFQAMVELYNFIHGTTKTADEYTEEGDDDETE
jgi:hypothetical protein